MLLFHLRFLVQELCVQLVQSVHNSARVEIVVGIRHIVALKHCCHLLGNCHSHCVCHQQNFLNIALDLDERHAVLSLSQLVNRFLQSIACGYHVSVLGGVLSHVRFPLGPLVGQVSLDLLNGLRKLGDALLSSLLISGLLLQLSNACIDLRGFCLNCAGLVRSLRSAMARKSVVRGSFSLRLGLDFADQCVEHGNHLLNR
mmetsp:Transcript_40162/g.96270  ORF Transcript_40162/g.96270 Transcript_40162/m.96270 type:complete len:200 (+) Transcript_40162:1457-2056(+)